MLADPQTLPALTAIGAREDLPRGAGQHGFGAIVADRRVMDVGIIEPAGDPRPALAAIAAAPYPVDLDPRPHDAVVRRVDAQRRHSRNADVRAFFGHVGAELLPMSPAV